MSASIVNRSVDTLSAAERNARTHSKRQIEAIAASIERFGFNNPVLIGEQGRIVAGHGRVAAAKLLGWKEVPTICLAHLSPAERRAYALADNKLAERAGWDQELLALEFKYLDELELELDLTLTGFETPEIDLLIGAAPEKEIPDPIDLVEESDKTSPPVSRIGDIWVCGRHRLICGDALLPETYEALLQGECADVVLTDPPYNVPIKGNVSGLGKVKHEEFVQASGEMSATEFETFLSTMCRRLYNFSRDGSIHFIFMDWRHAFELLQAGKEIYEDLKNIIVWNKSNGGMGSFYRSKHELIFVFKKGATPHVNNFELGQYGRHRTNVWDYAGANSFSKDRMGDLAMHPTVKPIALLQDAIIDCSHRNDIVLDAFSGSGGVMIAAERARRRARLIELDPHYVDVALQRFEKETGETPILQQNGKTFAQVDELRNSAMAGGEGLQDKKTSPANVLVSKEASNDQ